VPFEDPPLTWKWLLIDCLSAVGLTAIIVFVMVFMETCDAKADPVEPPNHRDYVIDLPRPDWLPGFRGPDEELCTEPEHQTREEVVERVINRWREDRHNNPPTVGGGGGHDDDDDDRECPPTVPEGSTIAMMCLGLFGLAMKGAKF